MTTVDSLIKDGKVHPFKATREEIERVLNLARRDLGEAEKIQASSLDWCFSIAYNSILQTCRAYMFHLGFRPASSEAHKITFQFMQIVVDQTMKQKVDYFDRVRKKRHRAIYDEAGLVTEREAMKLLDEAKIFLAYIEHEINNKK